MKVAKPDQEMFDSVTKFKEACELCIDKPTHSFTAPESQWKKLAEDDPERQEIELIRSRIASEEGISEKSVDDRILCYEYLKRKYARRLWHIIFTAEVLVDNCCDPTDDCLAFRPDMYFQHVAPEQ